MNKDNTGKNQTIKQDQGNLGEGSLLHLGIRGVREERFKTE